MFLLFMTRNIALLYDICIHGILALLNREDISVARLCGHWLCASFEALWCVLGILALNFAWNLEARFTGCGEVDFYI